MNEKICCFTGHREIEKGLEPYVEEVLASILQKLTVYGVTVFRAGGARGFDMLAEIEVLKLKKKEPDRALKLHLCLPCPDQAAKWIPSEQRLYQKILESSDGYTYAEPKYTRGCMYKRNRQLVDGADFCVAYYDGNGSGGTAYTVEYAESRGVSVINLYPLAKEAKRIHDSKKFFSFGKS